MDVSLKCTIIRTMDRIAYMLEGQEMSSGSRNEGTAKGIAQTNKTGRPA
jgi:hypothetical protein